MKLFSKLMVIIALGAGSTAAAAESSVGRASITGVTPYGGYQPYVLNIFLSNGKAPSSDAIRSDGKDGEIGFHSFSVTPGDYKIIYKCGTRSLRPFHQTEWHPNWEPYRWKGRC